MSESQMPSLIPLGKGSAVDPRDVRSVEAMDRSDEFPGIRERVRIDTIGGAYFIIEEFQTMQQAVAWAERFMDKVNAARGHGKGRA